MDATKMTKTKHENSLHPYHLATTFFPSTIIPTSTRGDKQRMRLPCKKPPWGTNVQKSTMPAQRANCSPNHWPVGPMQNSDRSGSPGRRPGLGEPCSFGAVATHSADRQYLAVSAAT